MDSDLDVSNKANFANMRRKFLKEKMRKHIRGMMLEGNESDFFDLDNFNRKYVKDTALASELVQEISEELQELGWKTFLGFGGTGLYVYSTEDLPPGAY